MSDAVLTAILLTAIPAVVRITAMVMTMPLVATRVVPMRVKVAFILALSLAVVPGAVATAETPSLEWTALLLTLVNEVLVGALMGLSCSIMLSGIQITGSVIEGLCGFSLASFGAPADSETGGGPLGKLFWWTTVAVFVAAGGVGQLIDGLLFSFTALPTGTSVFDQSFVDFLVTSIGYAFEFGVSQRYPRSPRYWQPPSFWEWSNEISPNWVECRLAWELKPSSVWRLRRWCCCRHRGLLMVGLS